jgi:hypothetical protein
MSFWKLKTRPPPGVRRPGRLRGADCTTVSGGALNVNVEKVGVWVTGTGLGAGAVERTGIGRGLGGRTGARAGLRGWLRVPITVMVLGEGTLAAVGPATAVVADGLAAASAAGFEPPEVMCSDGVGLGTTDEDWSACWVACEPMPCAVLTMSSIRPTQTLSITVPTRIWMAEDVIQRGCPMFTGGNVLPGPELALYWSVQPSLPLGHS